MMSNSTPSQFAAANEYADHVADYVSREATPLPPSTAAEVLVITEEYPHLLAEYLPLAMSDTPFRRALVDLVAEIADQQSHYPF